ncbi:hypothetical protein [Rossellomorea marisflavi]|uniref:hypothetical protein n=1 Tax=Rossellomorea marisflavi TaxID=189381 RepID=UPI003FA08D35
MLNLFATVSYVIASIAMVIGLGWGILNYRKYRVGSMLGMKGAKGIDKYLPTLILCVPALLVCAGSWFVTHGTFSFLEFATGFVIVIVDILYLLFFFAMISDLAEVVKEMEELLDTNNVTTYFWKVSDDKEDEQKNVFSFIDHFGFTPYENVSKKIVYRFEEGTDEQVIMDIARAYHEVLSLKNFLSSLPSEERLSEADIELVKELKQQIRELELLLKESSDILKSLFTHNLNAHFSDTELKTLEKLRQMPLRKKKETPSYIHPTIEALLQIQADPQVSPVKKAEAKELEKEVRVILEQQKKSMEWSSDENADRSILAVKMFLHIE